MEAKNEKESSIGSTSAAHKPFDHNLTAFRGIFCVLIVLFHYTDSITIQDRSFLESLRSWHDFHLIKYADKNVYFFFLLSGYILTRAYLVSTDPPKGFLKRRWLRIFPLHLTILAAYSIRELIFSRSSDGYYPWSALPLHALLIHNWIPDGLPGILSDNLITSLWSDWNFLAWTLSSEWFYYLLLALLLVFKKQYKITTRTLSVVIIFILILIAFNELLTTRHLLNPRLLHIDGIFFLGGILAALLIGKTKVCRSNLLQLGSICLYSLALLSQINYFLLFMSFLLIIKTFEDSETHTSRLICNRLSIWIGKRSFSMFLLHFPVLNLSRPLLEFFGRFAVPALFLLLLLFTEISYRIFERRIYHRSKLNPV